ncbi:hypothetical protein MMC18_007032 [Xylographa bjoerkii]|nr:hypothetical protein [Xylographa bjoerkii]
MQENIDPKLEAWEALLSDTQMLVTPEPKSQTYSIEIQKKIDSKPGGQKSMFLEGKPGSTTRISYFGMLDWISISATTLLILSAVLMIANVEGSWSTYPYPLHIGGQLSISSWTAIIGVEFSLFGTILLPRLKALFASKYLTKKLTSGAGLKLSTLLNAQESAPLDTQVRYGIKRLLAIRVMVIVVALTFSISYKFSFEMAAIQATVMIDGDTVDIGQLPQGGDGEFSTNLLDVIGFGDETSVVFANGTFIVGPAFNMSSVNSLLAGNITTCYPQPYHRSIYTSPDLKTVDTVGDERYRIIALNNNVNGTADILQSPNGSLQAGLGTQDSNGDVSYTDFVVVDTTFCIGYVSWSNVNQYSNYRLQSVQDMNCTTLPFDLTAWNNSVGTITMGFMQVALSGRGDPTLGVLDEATLLQFIVAHVLATLPCPDDFPVVQQTPYLEACSASSTAGHTNADHTLAATGLIANFGTQMTLFGFVLQILLVCAGLAAIGLFSWSPLPLLGEWPAQWLSLLNEFDKGGMGKSLEGTSVGGNAATGQTTVFLSSERVEGVGTFHLVLSTESGKVGVGRDHI